MKVVILAAGEGTRIKEIFPDTPKGLVPVKGRPIVEHLVEQYKDFEVLLNVRARDEAKFKYLGIPLLVEDTPLGNAGAVKFFIKELGGQFIATHVDTYSDLDPRKLIRAHKDIATMAVKDIAGPKEFGVITYNENLVTGFTRERFVNCGVYLFSKEVVNYIGEGFQDLDKDLFPKLIAQQRLHFYKHEGKWHDIGRPDYWKNCKENGGRT